MATQRLIVSLMVSRTFELLLLAALLAGPAIGAEPELVGELALAVQADNAEKLGLSEEQRQALYDVIDAREMKGIEQVMAARGLSAEERLKRLAPFRAESVRQGLEVLDARQQKMLKEIKSASDNPVFEAAAPANDEPSTASEQPSSEATPPAAEPIKAEPVEAEPIEKERPPQPGAEPLSAKEDLPPFDARGGKLSFNFRYQPWRDVLDWFAEQADLSLVLEAPPGGTFNYQDSRRYTIGEALDVLNSVLMTKGYTLVRKGRMLLLVNLEDEIPPNLVTDVPLSELDERGEYELVRVLFKVRNMLPEDAAEELQQMMGPQGKILVLPKAGMIQVTETAGRIRTLRSVIEAIEQPGGAGGDLHEYRLEYATAEDALPVLRQLLGIPADQMQTPTGSLQLAVDPLGMKLFAQGSAVQVRRLEEILELIDVPEAAVGGSLGETPQLEVYSISSIDPELVLNVLRTILGGNESTRIATDAQTGNLVALATPTEHATIRATLQQMQQDSRRVEVIPLYSVDPSLAVLAINKLFTNPAAGDEVDPRAPIVDADLSSNSLLVRASPDQIEQIKDFLDQLGEGDPPPRSTSGGNVRMLPIDASTTRSALTQVEQLWPMIRPNRIRVVTPSAAIPSYRPSGGQPPLDPLEQLYRQDGEFDERLFDEGSHQPAAPRAPSSSEEPSAAIGNRVRATFAAQMAPAEKASPEQAGPVSKPGAEIIVAPGPSGTIIASEDLEALDAFERLLENAAGQLQSGGRQFAVFYLKYAEATTAAETLAKVFGASSSTGGGLMGGIADAALGDLGGGLMGDLLGLGGGGSSAGFSSTSVDIIPDVRLNALVVYAQPTDLDTIDQLLRVLDQRAGPEPVEAGGKPRLIPVVNTQATDVAEVVKQVFSDRLQGGGGGGGQPSPEDLMRMLRRGAGGGGGGSTDQEPSKMTIGVDTRSNSIVVRAPDPLFAQVEDLVRRLDEDGIGRPQATRIVSLKHTNADTLKSTLQSLLGDSAVTSTNPAAAGGGGDNNNADRGRGRGDNNQNADAAREAMQRMEMFRRMREMQEQAAGGRGGGRGGRGGDQGGGGRGGRGGGEAAGGGRGGR